MNYTRPWHKRQKNDRKSFILVLNNKKNDRSKKNFVLKDALRRLKEILDSLEDLSGAKIYLHMMIFLFLNRTKSR